MQKRQVALKPFPSPLPGETAQGQGLCFQEESEGGEQVEEGFLQARCQEDGCKATRRFELARGEGAKSHACCDCHWWPDGTQSH